MKNIKKIIALCILGFSFTFAASVVASSINFALNSTQYVNFLSAPAKRLKASITGAATSFQLGDIKGWDGNDLNSSSFGGDAYAVFHNDQNTAVEIMQIDPTTIASGSITITARGLALNGDFSTSSARMLTWIKNTTIVELGTDVPQMLTHMVQIAGNQTIAGLKVFTTLPQSTGLTPSVGSDLTTKTYVDALAIAGAPVGTTSTAGIFMLASSLQTANGNTTGTYNSTVYNLIPYNNIFSSSSVSSTAYLVPVAVSGTIAASFINQTASATYNFLGGITMASETFSNATSGLLIATSTGGVSALKVGTTGDLVTASGTAWVSKPFSNLGGSMAIGSFVTATSTGSKSYTGVGFKPTYIEFYWSNNGSSGAASWEHTGYGAALSSASRFTQYHLSDTVGAADSKSTIATSNLDTTKVLTYLDLTYSVNTPTINTRFAADFISFDADGFTLNFSTATTSVGAPTIVYKAYK